MKIVVFGLAITSSWGNGHATTYRALARALHARGHRIVFFERDVEWYASNRDLPGPPFCSVTLFDDWLGILPAARRELRDADVAIVGSYFPGGPQAIDDVLGCNVPVKAFYDIDTPITVSQLRRGHAEYLAPRQVPAFDLYLSFTGGPMLQELERDFGARRAVPLYCSFDPERYRRRTDPRFTCDFSYMGTFAYDRQPKLEQLFCEPARRLSHRKFILAGPQYPASLSWPANVERITHLEPKYHASFYSSSRLTLNLTRADMARAGYSPSVRLFEAAACGAAIVSDWWDGLDSFFAPGKEILIAHSSADVTACLQDMDEDAIRRLGSAAQQRVLAEHTAELRARQFEDYVTRAAGSEVSLADAVAVTGAP